MAHARNIFVAAKQAPVWHERVDGRLVTQLSAGGTGNIAGDLAGRLSVTVVSSAATDEDKVLARQHPEGFGVKTAGNKDVHVQLVDHADVVLSREHYGVSTELLWQTMHLMWDGWHNPSWDAQTQAAWASLHTLNADIAQALVAQAHQATTAPIFLVHDYQLCLLPKKIRAACPQARILYFHHIAWPGADALEMLPTALYRDMVYSLLEADVIAFFATIWCRNFLHCVDSIIDTATVDLEHGIVAYQGRQIRVVSEPLSFSPDALDGLPRQWPEPFREWVGERGLIVHSGRSDPMKNAQRAIRAFVLAQQRGARPARMLIRVNPHRLHLTANAEYLAMVEHEVEHARQALNDPDCVRIIIGNDRALTLGAFAHADVAVFNSLSDGQNLSSFEAGIVGNAALVMSPKCGASEVLGPYAYIANPYDLEDQANALAQALDDSAEKRRQDAEARRSLAREYELPQWTERQLKWLA